MSLREKQYASNLQSNHLSLTTLLISLNPRKIVTSPLLEFKDFNSCLVDWIQRRREKFTNTTASRNHSTSRRNMKQAPFYPKSDTWGKNLQKNNSYRNAVDCFKAKVPKAPVSKATIPSNRQEQATTNKIFLTPMFLWRKERLKIENI